MALERVIEQPKAKRIVESMVRGNRLPHALLFWGSQGIGKSAAAIELARWLNCQKGLDGPCSECESCLAFRSLEHPHFSYQLPMPGKALTDSETGELTAAGSEQLAEIYSTKGKDPYRTAEYPGGQFILIGQIRSLLRWASKRSFTDKPRVALIDHADRLREEAGNALLKLLEEPPPDFILILTAETPEDILPTLKSRCQQVEFDRLKRNTIENELRQRGLGNDQDISRIAHLSEGNLSRALDFAQHPDHAAQLYDLAINIVRHSLSRNPLEFDPLMENWSGKSLIEQFLILEIISSWLRDAALIKSQNGYNDHNVIHSNRVDLLKKFVNNCPDADFITACQEVEKARRNLENNALTSLTLLVLARNLYEAIYRKKPV